jgi:hypothetical protein
VFAKNQAKYAVGVEFEANPRTTVVVDLVGRQLMNGGQVEYQTFPAMLGTGTADLLVATPEGLSQVALAPGVKFNVWRSVLITGNVLASLTTGGVRARFIPVFGVDWAF